jgi:hypothetical protein
MDNITLKSLSHSTLALLFAAGISTAAVAAEHEMGATIPTGGEAKIEAPKDGVKTDEVKAGISGEIKEEGKLEEKKLDAPVVAPLNAPVQPVK